MKALQTKKIIELEFLSLSSFFLIEYPIVRIEKQVNILPSREKILDRLSQILHFPEAMQHNFVLKSP